MSKPKYVLASETQRLLKACRDRLAAHYGTWLAGIVLYGSAARGEAGPQSDLDLLVLLHPSIDPFAELHTVVDVLYPLQLTTDRLISARPVPADAYARGATQLYRNAQAEGFTWRVLPDDPGTPSRAQPGR